MNNPAGDASKRASPPESPTLGVVRARLTEWMGKTRADEVVDAAIAESGGGPVESPQRVLSVADALVRRGGVVEVVGRSLRSRALLAGARLDLDEAQRLLDSVRRGSEPKP